MRVPAWVVGMSVTTAQLTAALAATTARDQAAAMTRLLTTPDPTSPEEGR